MYVEADSVVSGSDAIALGGWQDRGLVLRNGLWDASTLKQAGSNLPHAENEWAPAMVVGRDDVLVISGYREAAPVGP